MGHKCFISYKKEDQYYRDRIDHLLDKSNLIDKGLDRIINSEDGDYIMEVIRRDYLKDSTVTIFVIGTHSSENEGYDSVGRRKNYFIEREMQASLYDGTENTRNGVLGVVLPEMYNRIYKGSHYCSSCGEIHNTIMIEDSTVIREFSMNYYIEPHYGCGWSEYERYCVLVKWDDFVLSPERYVDAAFRKRTSESASKVKVRNFRV